MSSGGGVIVLAPRRKRMSEQEDGDEQDEIRVSSRKRPIEEYVARYGDNEEEEGEGGGNDEDQDGDVRFDTAVKLRECPESTALFDTEFPSEKNAKQCLSVFADRRGMSYGTKNRYAGKNKTVVTFACSKNRVCIGDYGIVDQRERCGSKIVLTIDSVSGKCRFDPHKSILLHNGHLKGEIHEPARRAKIVFDQEEEGFVLVYDEDDVDAGNGNGNGNDPDPIALARESVYQELVEKIAASREEMSCERIRLEMIRILFARKRVLDARLCDWAIRKPGGTRNEFLYSFRGIRDGIINRRSFYSVDVIESAREFEACLREEDRAYFTYWAKGRRKDCVVMFKVRGACAVDMQSTFMAFQKKYGVFSRGVVEEKGWNTHAVFSSPTNREGECYVIIEKYVLYSYRLFCAMHIPEAERVFPLTPVLLQSWALRPVNIAESYSRRFAILCNVHFLLKHLGYREVKPNKLVYGVNEPQFELYDFLPEIIDWYQPTDTELIKNLKTGAFIYIQVKEKSKKKVTVTRTRTRTNTILNAILSFLLQKRTHYTSEKVIDRLYWAFMQGPNSVALSNKYPHARMVLRYLRAQLVPTNKQIEIKIPSWSKLDYGTYSHIKRPTDDYLPHYFLYQLCFESELLDHDTQNLFLTETWLCREIVLPGDNIEREMPILPNQTIVRGKLTEFRNQRRRASKKLLFETSLFSYEDLYVRPIDTRQVPALVPFSDNTSDIWPLNGLYVVLKTLENLSKGSPIKPFCVTDGFKELAKEDDDLVTGTLTIRDPAKFSIRPCDVPVAVALRDMSASASIDQNREKIAYFHQTVLALHSSVYPTDEAGWRLLEAYVLVRDPRFYSGKINQN